MWAVRADKPAECVVTNAGGDVEAGLTPGNIFRDSDETAADVPETTDQGLPAPTTTVMAVDDVPGDTVSGMANRCSGDRDDSYADIMKVGVFVSFPRSTKLS
jgi:hypothetical protein